MQNLLLLLQFLVALALIIAVLLHAAKGEGLGGIGAPARVFGSQKGLEEGLDKITAICAAAFIIVSLLISIITI